MVDNKPNDVIARVATRWLLNHEKPPQAFRSSSLPVALVASLKVGDQVQGVNGIAYEVSSVGPGALAITDSNNVTTVFTNHGYGAYSWAYYAAPYLHWLFNR